MKADALDLVPLVLLLFPNIVCARIVLQGIARRWPLPETRRPGSNPPAPGNRPPAPPPKRADLWSWVPPAPPPKSRHGYQPAPPTDHDRTPPPSRE